MYFERVRDELFEIDIGLILRIVNFVRTVQNHQPSSLTVMKSAFDSRHRVLHFDYLLIRICLSIIKESVDLNIVPLDRLLRSSFDPEYGSVVSSIFANIIQHQLRFTRFIEPSYC